MSDSDTNAGDAGDAGEPGGTEDVDAEDVGTAGDSEFDKEAEREKLREKFARDEEKRESTRRMSELLLKGATMTNRHCDTCGDPLFRQNGQEFCATCQAEPPADDGAVEGDGPVEDDAADPRQVDAVGETTERSADAPLDEGPGDEQQSVDPAGRRASDAPTTQRHTTDRRRTPPSKGGSDGRTESAPASTGGVAQSDDRPTSSSPAVSPTDTTESTGDLANARDALVAALTRHATAGADTDDPRTARDHLAAAREAAEALAALRR